MTKKKHQTSAVAKHKDGSVAGISTEINTEDILPCNPDDLRKFDSIYPEASAEILREYLARSATQRKILESYSLMVQSEAAGRVNIARTGQVIAAMISISVLGLAGLLIWQGRDIGIIIALITAITALVAVFMGKKNSNSSK